MHRHYRNTDKSHAFEHESAVEVLSLTGAEADRKVDELRGTRSPRIQGDNVGNHRQRVQPMQAVDRSAEVAAGRPGATHSRHRRDSDR